MCDATTILHCFALLEQTYFEYFQKIFSSRKKRTRYVLVGLTERQEWTRGMELKDLGGGLCAIGAFFNEGLHVEGELTLQCAM